MFKHFWTGSFPNPDVATISDYFQLFWSIAKFIYFLPGNSIIYLIVSDYPRLGNFLEMSSYSFNGWVSGILSFISWFILLLVIGIIYATFEKWGRMTKIKKDTREKEEIRRKRRELGYDND